MSLLIHVYLQLGDNTETRAVCALSFLLIFLIFQSFWWSGGRPGKTGDIIEPHIRPTNKMMHQSQKREWLELRPGIRKVKKYKEKKFLLFIWCSCSYKSCCGAPKLHAVTMNQKMVLGGVNTKVGRLVGGIRREVSFVRKLEVFAVNAEPRGKKTERYRSQCFNCESEDNTSRLNNNHNTNWWSH